VGRKRREDRLSVQDEVVGVRLPRDVMAALSVFATRTGDSLSGAARSILRRALLASGDLPRRAPAAPPDKDPIMEEAGLMFGDSEERASPPRQPKRRKRRGRRPV
jgi:plasmid stability protein